MKHLWTKATALLLCFAMLAGPVSAAAQVTPDGHVLREPEKMEGFVFPETWSENALRFCVSNGILSGNGESLAEKDNATRAEMATMLVAVLGLTEQADLSAYTDVSPDDWFYDKMAAAVQAGILSGTSATTLSPAALLTREQAVTMLRKAFALNAEQFDRWEQFTDSGSVSAYARPAVSALAEKGFVTGFPDGSFRPANKITREEIAQIFYALFTCISDNPDQLADSGRILYRGADLPGNQAVDGNLTLCGGNVSGGSVSGVLTLRGSDVRLNGCRVDTVSLAAGSDLDGNIYPKKLFVTGGDSVVKLGADTLFVYGDAELDGAYETVHLMADGLTYGGDSDTVCVYGNATLSGSCREILCREDGTELRFARPAEVLRVFGNSAIRGDANTVHLHADASLSGGYQTISCEADGISVSLSGGAGSVEITGDTEFTGNAKTVCISSDAVLNGSYEKIVCDQDGVRLTLNGHADRIEIPVDDVTVRGSGSADYVDVPGKNFDIRISCGEIEDHVLHPEEEAAQIDTLIVWDVTTRDTNLYSDSGLTSRIRSLPKGTRLEHHYLQDGATAASVYTEDGVFGYVPLDGIQIPEGNEIREPYSEEAMEYFINHRNLSSSSGYLVWVSLQTQTANVFTGSNGSWNLAHSFTIASGKNATPTARGTFHIIEKLPVWDYGRYYVKNVSRFYQGYAFHSVTYWANGTVMDPSLGHPASHGCIRMSLEDSEYIYNHVPTGSTVLVY